MKSGRIPTIAVPCPQCGAVVTELLAPIRRGRRGGEQREQWHPCPSCRCGVTIILTAKRIPPGGYALETRSTGLPLVDDMPF